MTRRAFVPQVVSSPGEPGTQCFSFFLLLASPLTDLLLETSACPGCCWKTSPDTQGMSGPRLQKPRKVLHRPPGDAHPLPAW